MSDWLERDEKAVWHPYTGLPVLGPKRVITRAAGSYLFDEGGKRYFDATSSWWCQIHGHCHPRLVKALSHQAANLDQMLFAPHTHPTAIELSERLLSVTRSQFGKVFFSDNGSTAVEVAMKLAVQHWAHRGEKKRVRFLSLEHAYHGDTLGTIAVSGVPQFHRVFDSLQAKSLSVTAPYCYRCPLSLHYPDCNVECLDSTRRTLRRYQKEIAAAVIEPLVQGAGGMITYPKEYLERFVALCQEYGVLTIGDEVFTGFGRTGTMFAVDQISQKYDFMCLSKGLTSGMLPLAATLVRDEIWQGFTGDTERAFYHGHTFTANAIGCAVALESLRIFEEENVVSRNAHLTKVMASQTQRFSGLSVVGDVRHLGMIWAVETVADRATKRIAQPANAFGWRVATELWDKGIWIRPLGNVIYVIPPYCTEPKELELVFDVLYDTIQKESHSL